MKILFILFCLFCAFVLQRYVLDSPVTGMFEYTICLALVMLLMGLAYAFI